VNLDAINLADLDPVSMRHVHPDTTALMPDGCYGLWHNFRDDQSFEVLRLLRFKQEQPTLNGTESDTDKCLAHRRTRQLGLRA
jgi:hypothetical protein